MKKKILIGAILLAVVSLIPVTSLAWNKKGSITKTSQDTAIVYITKTGAKYHADGCRYLRKSRIAISKEDAIKKGYTPCSVCNP